MHRNHSLLYAQWTWYDFWSICTGFSCENTRNLQLNPTWRSAVPDQCTQTDLISKQSSAQLTRALHIHRDFSHASSLLQYFLLPSGLLSKDPYTHRCIQYSPILSPHPTEQHKQQTKSSITPHRIFFFFHLYINEKAQSALHEQNSIHPKLRMVWSNTGMVRAWKFPDLQHFLQERKSWVHMGIPTASLQHHLPTVSKFLLHPKAAARILLLISRSQPSDHRDLCFTHLVLHLDPL